MEPDAAWGAPSTAVTCLSLLVSALLYPCTEDDPRRPLSWQVIKNAFCSGKSTKTATHVYRLPPPPPSIRLQMSSQQSALMKFRATSFSPTHRTIFKTYVNVLFCSLLLNLLFFNIFWAVIFLSQKKNQKCNFQKIIILNLH